MALINCPNCNNLVSDKAIKCPHCGIDLTPVENIPNTEVNAPIENVEPISQIDQKLTNKTSSEASHTLRNVLIGIVALLAICGGCGAFWFYYSSNKEITTSSNLDIAKIVAEIDRDMAAKANDDAIEKQNAEKRLEEFKNFQSNDLAAFMLHGKVKKVTCFSGQSFTCCEFNEEGKLSKYTTGDNHHECNYEISHDGNSIVLVMEGTLGSFGENYRVKDGKLVEYACGGDGIGERIVYDNHDSNNWAKSKSCYEYDLENDSWNVSRTYSITYSDIDQYGNWTTSKDENGYTMESREIEYYPIQ